MATTLLYGKEKPCFKDGKARCHECNREGCANTMLYLFLDKEDIRYGDTPGTLTGTVVFWFCDVRCLQAALLKIC